MGPGYAEGFSIASARCWEGPRPNFGIYADDTAYFLVSFFFVDVTFIPLLVYVASKFALFRAFLRVR